MPADPVTGTRPCPLCQQLDRRVVFRQAEHEVVQCARCAMVYLAREISYATQMEEYEFSESYLAEHGRRKTNHPMLLYISGWTRRLKPEIGDRLLQQTLRWRGGGKLVDFGCGDGKFLECAARHFEVTGVELSPKLAAMAAHRVSEATILRSAVTQAPLPDGEFDVVTQFSVLEHEWHPREALRVAHRVLKPGGVTVMKVPNYASWNRRIMGRDWCGFRLPDHCNYFTPQTLTEILRRAGLHPLRGSLLDRFPTSDSLWMAAKKPDEPTRGIDAKRIY